MHPLFTDLYTTLLHVFLPVRCVVCKQESPEAVCNTCLTNFTVVPTQICPNCHTPSIAGLVHATCAHPQSLDQLISLYDYKNKHVAELIITGKYKFVPDAFHTIAPHISAFVKNYIDLPADVMIAPLPLHRFRERWRGFNQAGILSEHIAQDLNIPYGEALVRHRRTKTQKDLRKADRVTNVANCFSLAPQTDVHKKIVLLVDDVTTSGSTLQEAAKILKQHGASQVIGITLARD